MTDDFFRNRLDQMIDLRHPLAVLANRARGIGQDPGQGQTLGFADR